MSGGVINLRRARKARAKALARREADANAARHGESPGLRRLRESEAEQLRRTVEGAKRDASEPDG